jgi:hypothetical protein
MRINVREAIKDTLARHRAPLAVVLALSLAAGAATVMAGAPQPSTPRPGPARHLPAPQYLSAQSRAELTTRMGQHGATMSNLVRAVVLLDRPTVRTLAGRIADEEIVAGLATRSGGPSPLPEAFTRQQADLRTAAQRLAVAAALGGDDETLADQFGAVTRTCVSCHAVYLHGLPSGR